MFYQPPKITLIIEQKIINSTMMHIQSLQMLPLANIPFNLVSSLIMSAVVWSMSSLILSSILFCYFTSTEKFSFSSLILSTTLPILSNASSYPESISFYYCKRLTFSLPFVFSNSPSSSRSITCFFLKPISSCVYAAYAGDEADALLFYLASPNSMEMFV